MPQISVKARAGLTDAIIKTLAFFSLYGIPLTSRRIWELLYETKAEFAEVEQNLRRLSSAGTIEAIGAFYALKPWDQRQYEQNNLDLLKRWKLVRKYQRLLATLPFTQCVCVINSIAIGSVKAESDIDFFVITKADRLYIVRSIIILIFKLLGVYKNRTHIANRFCFGFYVSEYNLRLEHLLLKPDDPYFAFWLATILPLDGFDTYQNLIHANPWLKSYFPNFDPIQRRAYLGGLVNSGLKKFLELLLAVPAFLIEPLARFVHIRHTFNLPENRWSTSSTVANKHMLKLHALDPRQKIRDDFFRVISQTPKPEKLESDKSIL
ncbi:MAG: hypothetical protein A3H72_02440 [Candidatus Doudnabacteria bacterium RIFCSPLOWO2_02_FULL_48_8]|uniref:Polymerase nucleotidyl transferase domain-containing protein n=1 Tax=Candidatus Doudnabacteria bacterium RIFCSPHIGHO2_01_FULL_46_24 TaxID=1817825 RepID=A0A1F5NVK4_9BACT|nr:MAG: hypothetical protein A2720_02205 [Candidatus Doudnabacteria bacterium RIFCSPHIGHO2_01_FULL_46_24]OGE95270.1 MAG: hypothetical protein A3H72_02440 [Candidatus Doudnabacteria bacterium RIFCSPLOWO2_02_FULL_48_8]OGE95543.1 MAG: hypothetical protein A3E98_01885 [Candidatus Doudnabacteria bacterium RIFCSPHIGHO2_12_FULL_48_11]